MNATAKTAPAQFEGAADILMEIAVTARRADRLCYFADPTDLDDAETVIATLRALVCQIGWIADEGLIRFSGHHQIVGGPADWMLSPKLNRALNPQEVTSQVGAH